VPLRQETLNGTASREVPAGTLAVYAYVRCPSCQRKERVYTVMKNTESRRGKQVAAARRGSHRRGDSLRSRKMCCPQRPHA